MKQQPFWNVFFDIRNEKKKKNKIFFDSCNIYKTPKLTWSNQKKQNRRTKFLILYVECNNIFLNQQILCSFQKNRKLRAGKFMEGISSFLENKSLQQQDFREIETYFFLIFA